MGLNFGLKSGLKSLLAGILISSSVSLTNASETISDYHNYSRKAEVTAITNSNPIVRSPSGILNVDYPTFRVFGFDYLLVGKLAKELANSPFVVSELGTKKYRARYSGGVYDYESLEEVVKDDEMHTSIYVRNETDRFSALVNISVVPNGSNCTYSTTAYILPDSTFKKYLAKTLLYLFPAFEKKVDGDISAIRTYGVQIYTELRNHPEKINQLKEINDDQKQRLNALFGPKDKKNDSVATVDAYPVVSK